MECTWGHREYRVETRKEKNRHFTPQTWFNRKAREGESLRYFGRDMNHMTLHLTVAYKQLKLNYTDI